MATGKQRSDTIAREAAVVTGIKRVRLRPRVKQARRADARQPRPKAMCPECGMVSVYTEHINRRCARLFEVPGEDEPVRCEGRFRAAIMREDWTVCPDCGATGLYQGEPCARCDTTGWRYVPRDARR